MAKFNVSGETPVVQTQVTENPFPHVRLSINKNLTDGQKSSGLVAKVQVSHPAVKFQVDVWKSKFGEKLYTNEVNTSYTLATGQTRTDVIIVPDARLMSYIFYAVQNDVVNEEPWYLQELGRHNYAVTQEDNNESLHIEKISIDARDVRRDGGNQNSPLVKVDIKLDIGSFNRYAVWESRFENSLYGNAPQSTFGEGKELRRNPLYRLTDPAVAQILGYLHSMADFTESAPTRTPAANSQMKAIEEAKKELARMAAKKDIDTEVPFDLDD